jgi:hypothetical protein
MLKEFLVGFGGFADSAGIILVGFPDVVPHARRVAAALVAAWWRVAALVRRLFGRSRTHEIALGTAVGTEVALPIEVRRGDPFEGLTTDAERVARLMELYLVTRSALDNLLRQIGTTAEAFREEMGRRDTELEQGLEKRWREEVDLYLPQRTIGIPALLAGTTMLCIANFVG